MIGGDPDMRPADWLEAPAPGNSGCARFRPHVGEVAMMERPDIIQMNVDRYRELLSLRLDDDTRARLEQLLENRSRGDGRRMRRAWRGW